MDSRERDEKSLFAELRALYAGVDARYAGWSCPSSTECCRFDVTGREPYVTSLEEAFVRRAVAERGGPRALAAKTKRSDKRELAMIREERRCPLLDPAGRCTVYAARPLGCRTFYCDRATPGEAMRQADVNELVRRVQALAQKHRPDGDRGRPLTRALADLNV